MGVSLVLLLLCSTLAIVTSPPVFNFTAENGLNDTTEYGWNDTNVNSTDIQTSTVLLSTPMGRRVWLCWLMAMEFGIEAMLFTYQLTRGTQRICLRCGTLQHLTVFLVVSTLSFFGSIAIVPNWPLPPSQMHMLGMWKSGIFLLMLMPLKTTTTTSTETAHSQNINVLTRMYFCVIVSLATGLELVSPNVRMIAGVIPVFISLLFNLHPRMPRFIMINCFMALLTAITLVCSKLIFKILANGEPLCQLWALFVLVIYCQFYRINLVKGDPQHLPSCQIAFTAGHAILLVTAYLVGLSYIPFLH